MKSHPRSARELRYTFLTFRVSSSHASVCGLHLSCVANLTTKDLKPQNVLVARRMSYFLRSQRKSSGVTYQVIQAVTFLGWLSEGVK